MFSGHLVMNDNEQTSQDQTPSQQVFVIASIACFVSLMIIYWVASPAVKLLEVRWVELLAYAIIPLSVTFIILYRSCWHREITGAARTCSLLLLSCVILSCEFIAIGIMLCIGLFCFNAISGGNH
jgi:hypothetical protein